VIEITVDGLCEPVNSGGIATYGFVIRRNGSVIASGAGVVEVEDASNNVAEYMAAIKAFEWLASNDPHDEKAVLKSDSELLINQLRGAYAVQAPRIVPLYHALRSLLGRLEQKRIRVMYKWIPWSLRFVGLLRAYCTEADRRAAGRGQEMEVRS
jgi:ribonuclease HI